MEVVDSLPGDRREAFVPTQLLGLPYAEAAELSRCRVGTVRSRVSRARTALAEWAADGSVPRHLAEPAVA